MLRRHFRCELCFDAAHDLLVFDEEALALSMVNRNAQLLSILLPGLESAVEQDKRARTFADDVRQALCEHMCGGRPALGKVAKRLGMSARTMQRRLGELGTTYQGVLDDIRQRSARQLLTNTNLGIGQVAFVLGFEEVNSFTRALLAWEGATPAKWRERASVHREPQKRAWLCEGRRARPRSRQSHNSVTDDFAFGDVQFWTNRARRPPS